VIEATGAVLALLVGGVYVGVRIAREAREMNGWVAHTQDVLNEASAIRLRRSRMQNDLWFYRSTGQPELAERYKADRTVLLGATERLGDLTKDNPPQHADVEKIETLVRSQVGLLDAALEEARRNQARGESQRFEPVLPLNDGLVPSMDRFEAAERALFSLRSQAVRSNAEWTLGLQLVTGALGCLALLLSGYYVQREVVMRAQVEVGLKRARELLGTKLDQRQSELHHAVEDVNAQIIARNIAEERLRELNAELEARVAARTRELKEMNKELESFNYSVSHDLRAPLRHMDGFSRILEEEFSSELSGEARHYVERIRLAAQQMSNLVDDLLQLARFGRQAVKLEPTDLNRMVNETIAACTAEEGERQIVWQVAELPPVEADPGLMRPVFANLISNAVKFTGKRERPAIEIGYRRTEREVTVFVKDNGAGFDSKYSDKLFGVFQRLHRQDEFEGTGIGLAIVARIVHRHGGRVWAEGEPDKGATVYFSLTAAPQLSKPVEEMVGAHL
jgi:signal transduction histidine kinase